MANSLVIKIDGDTSSLEKSLGNVGSVATKALATATAAVVGLGAAATAVGKEFETAFAGTSTMFGDVAVDTEGLKDQILDLSNATGESATALTESLYNALSAGIPVTEDMTGAMEYMAKSEKLAKAGFTDIDTAVSATAKVMNAYGGTLDDVDSIQKVMLQTQNKGITTVDELGASLSNVTPTASAMGVSFANVGASLATMTAQGTPTAQATTQLNSLIAELGKEGTMAAGNLEKAAEGTEYAGMSFTEMMEAGVPLNEVLDLMDGYAEDSGLSMIDLFSSLEAGKAALALGGDNSAKYAENLEAMGTSADVVGDAYDTMTDTLDTKLAKLKENVKNLGIELYDKLLPVFEPLLEDVIEFIENFDLDETIQQVKDFYAALEPWLPLVAGVVGAFVALLAAIKIASFIQALSAAFGALNAVMAANPILLIVTLLAALVAAFITAYNTNDEFRAKVDEVFAAIKEVTTDVLNGIIEFFTVTLPAAFSSFTTFLTGAFSTDWSERFGFFGEILNAFFQNVENIVGSIKTVFEGILDFVKAVFAGDWQAAWQAIQDIFGGIFGGLVDIAKSPINMIIGLLNGMIGAINSAITGINSLRWDVPSWVPGIGGESWGFNLPTMGEIPYLAKGAVLPPNKPFMAMVGDQRNGTNVEAPLDTIKQALSEVLANMNGSVSGLFNGSLATSASVTVGGAQSDGNSLLSQAVGLLQQIANTQGQDITLDGQVIYTNQQRVSSARGYNLGMGAFAR